MEEHTVVRVVTKLLIAPILLFALYVQFHGEISPGGGFQAGVIFASAFILYGVVFGLRSARRAMPPAILRAGAGLGVLLYTGTGLTSIALGGDFLDYDVLLHDPVHGQELGLMLVEFGVGLTVAATIVSIFFAFAGRGRRGESPDG